MRVLFRKRKQRTAADVLADLALGLAAGAAATWVMGKATTYMYEHEDAKARRKEDRVRGGRTAFESAAEKAAGMVGWGLSDEERKSLGAAIHWALGIGTGAAYALLRRRVRKLAALQGTVFGTGFWLLVDEALNTILRLTPGPLKFPWQAHARGWAGHLVYGAAINTTLDAAEYVMRRARRR